MCVVCVKNICLDMNRIVTEGAGRLKAQDCKNVCSVFSDGLNKRCKGFCLKPLQN